MIVNTTVDTVANIAVADDRQKARDEDSSSETSVHDSNGRYSMTWKPNDVF